MSTINKAIIVGKLSGAPQTKLLPSGATVTTFSIPTSEGWKDKATGEKKEITEWHRIVAYRKLGEICGEYLNKGSLVYVEGKIQTRSWVDSNDIKISTTEIIASKMEMLGPAKSTPEPDVSFDFGFNKADVFSKTATKSSDVGPEYF